jgi:nascent polypeptide-associated complex subunit beta
VLSFVDFLKSVFFLSCLCRKKKAVHKPSTTDDKKLQSTLKRIGVNTIPAIEEVNIFKDDLVIQFVNPKVQASIPANTWVISGTPQTRSKFLCYLYVELYFCLLIISTLLVSVLQ